MGLFCCMHASFASLCMSVHFNLIRCCVCSTRRSSSGEKDYAQGRSHTQTPGGVSRGGRRKQERQLRLRSPSHEEEGQITDRSNIQCCLLVAIACQRHLVLILDATIFQCSGIHACHVIYLTMPPAVDNPMWTAPDCMWIAASTKRNCSGPQTHVAKHSTDAVCHSCSRTRLLLGGSHAALSCVRLALL